MVSEPLVQVLVISFSYDIRFYVVCAILGMGLHKNKKRNYHVFLCFYVPRHFGESHIKSMLEKSVLKV